MVAIATGTPENRPSACLPLCSPFLHLLPSTSRNFSSESVEIGSRAWKGHKEEETKCDELGEGPKSREERDSSGAKKKELRKRARETRERGIGGNEKLAASTSLDLSQQASRGYFHPASFFFSLLF